VPRPVPRTASDPIPARAGVGFKLEHYCEIVEQEPAVGWFEVHAENFMGEGGEPHFFLTNVRQRYPLSVHGVGLSIGGTAQLDQSHLTRLKAVCDNYQPGLVSEHLAWSTHEGVFLNDLLPLPYNGETLQLVCEHIDEVQTFLGREILIENPSTYVRFESSEMPEVEFLAALSRTTGCGLLLDVNNVYVSATNHGYDAFAYVDSFPIENVGEIHLGGYAEDCDETGACVLIDAHGSQVADPVWRLYERAIARGGRKPTLIEWDNEVPGWPVLYAEARRADQIMGV
jgi:uncharacterized protein